MPDSSDNSSHSSSMEEVNKMFQKVFERIAPHMHIFNISSHKTYSDQQQSGDMNSNVMEGHSQRYSHSSPTAAHQPA